MGQFILHKDGAYNLYTTVADGCCYERALTLEQLQEVLWFEGGQAATDQLPERLARAHATGCSALPRTTLAECIEGNRAGPNESEMAFDDFVQRYLTLPAPESGPFPGATSGQAPVLLPIP